MNVALNKFISPIQFSIKGHCLWLQIFDEANNIRKQIEFLTLIWGGEAEASVSLCMERERKGRERKGRKEKESKGKGKQKEKN